MDHKVPYGSCESSLDLFIYNYFSFLNGAHVEPYRIFCIWSVFFKWVSNSFVFKECFHKTEFWMALFPPVDSLAHSWHRPLTPWCCLGRTVFILISLLTPLRVPIWIRSVSALARLSLQLLNLAPDCTLSKFYLTNLLESVLAWRQQKYISWVDKNVIICLWCDTHEHWRYF